MASFLAHGHDYHLYRYGDLEDVPTGVKIKDANSVIPESDIFTYDGGSHAGFADWFRHKLVCQTGQFWVDTDIVF